MPDIVAWIDRHKLTGDAIGLALQLTDTALELIHFPDIQSCIDAEPSGLSLVVYYHHPVDGDLMAAITLLRDAHPSAGILTLIDPGDLPRMQAMRSVFPNTRYGIVSTQSTSIRMLLTAMNFVLAGGVFYPAEMMVSTDRQIIIPKVESRDNLTPREIEVRGCLRAGQSNKVIAYNLTLSESTIKVHVRNIMRKVGATNRTQAALKDLDIRSTVYFPV